MSEELKPCPKALYSCNDRGCAIEQTFPPEDLFWSDEKQSWFCRECYGDFANPDQTLAQYLTRAESSELTRLRAENSRLTIALETVMKHHKGLVQSRNDHELNAAKYNVEIHKLKAENERLAAENAKLRSAIDSAMKQQP